MRKGILTYILIAGWLWSFGQDDPVLMTIEGKAVHLSEFQYIYEKNNGENADYSKESVDEYLDLFTNFKLKVHKAKELKMDTIPVLQEELAGYRKQLATSYMKDKELSDRLIKEMWERRKEDVHVAHILFKLRKNPTPEEKETALKKASDVYKRFKNGESFEALASTQSDDTASAANGGSLGFITAWLPSGFYELENAAYGTPVGAVSEPIITRLGVHLIKVIEKRPAFGKIEVAHILMRKSDKPGTDDPKEKIENIYALIKQGNDFATIASQFSEDGSSSKNEGKLPPFGINTYERSFEKAAFSLKNNGDISEPIETRVGWHIIKRISKPVESYEMFHLRMKPQLAKMERYGYIEDRLIEEIKEETNYKRDQEAYTDFINTLDSTFLSYKWKVPQSDDQKILVDMGENYRYTVYDFATYLKKNARTRMRYSRELSPQEAGSRMYDSFVREKAMLYEEKNLEKKYPDFKALMREYEEGILLFEVSKNEVWDKASQDTNGLKTYFEKNKMNYFDPMEAEIATYTFPRGRGGYAQEVWNHATDNDPQATLDEFNNKVTTVNIEIEIKSEVDAAMDNIEFKTGALSKIKTNEDGSVEFKKIIKFLPKKYRSLEESRGYVIADYQQYLEEQWINSLKKEFSVEYNEDVLDALVK